MTIHQALTAIENYTLAVQDVESAGSGLLAALEDFFNEIEQGENFTKNDLLAFKEQFLVSQRQEDLAKALSGIKTEMEPNINV